MRPARPPAPPSRGRYDPPLDRPHFAPARRLSATFISRDGLLGEDRAIASRYGGKLKLSGGAVSNLRTPTEGMKIDNTAAGYRAAFRRQRLSAAGAADFIQSAGSKASVPVSRGAPN